MEKEILSLEKWEEIGKEIKEVERIIDLLHDISLQKYQMKGLSNLDLSFAEVRRNLEDAMLTEHRDKTNEEVLSIFR